jgi:hypothetical protein
VDVVSALDCQQRREQADRARAGHEHAVRVEARARPDALDLLPRLRHDARRLEQHADVREAGIDAHRELRLDAPALRAITVALLDPALGVAAVAAEVPLAARAAGARDRVRAADDAHDQVAWAQAGAGRALAHPPERLVAEHEPLLPLGRPAVLAPDDLRVGPADAECKPVHEHRAGVGVRLGNLVEAGRAGLAWDHRDGAHRAQRRGAG